MDKELKELIISGGLKGFSAVLVEKCKDESYSLLTEGRTEDAKAFAMLPTMLDKIINTLEIDIKKEMTNV